MSKASQKPSGTISLFEAAKLTGYHQDYLGQLCRAGKISAMKLGRNWYTTEQAVRDYFASGVAQLKQPEPLEQFVPSRPAVDGLPIGVFGPGDVAPVATEPIHGGWAVQSYDQKSIAAERNRKLFRNNHLRTALLTSGAAIAGLIIAGGLLSLTDTFFGRPGQSVVTNYDASRSTFSGSSVAGAVDEPVPEVLLELAPRLKPPE